MINGLNKKYPLVCDGLLMSSKQLVDFFSADFTATGVDLVSASGFSLAVLRLSSSVCVEENSPDVDSPEIDEPSELRLSGVSFKFDSLFSLLSMNCIIFFFEESVLKRW